ncbi:MAG: phytanoyl-CoA dioxygenase family protein [Acidimicrobiales bacterium]|jgi:ectoine hydroxylase-related dioxygenase (phytanoyl-CoA dioxygenase family)
MRDEPTASEKDFYHEHGFLSVSEFLQHDELEDWRVKVDTAVMNRRGQRLSFASEDATNIASQTTSKEEQDYYNSVFTQRVNLWQTDEAFRELLLQEALGSFVGKLAGVDGLRIWHDQALIKEPYANPTSFHLDVPYWSFTSADAITIWIALDDATLENGCLYYVPDSHKARKFDNVAIGPAIGALFDVYPEWRDVKAAACPVPAGGAVFHNGLTFHGAGANMTPGRRRAITCAYMPDGATFNGQRNVLPDEYLATLTVGDVLNNEAQNPLVYSRALDDHR